MYSRDVLDLREIAEEWQAIIDDEDDDTPTDAYEELCSELGIDQDPAALDWWANNYEPTLVHEDYFTEYARELAYDIGAMSEDLSWPAYCIDWELAARELQYDYTSVDYDGNTYYIRSV